MTGRDRLRRYWITDIPERVMGLETLAVVFSIVLPILGAILLAWRNLHQDISDLGQRIARIEGWLEGWRTPYPNVESS